MKRELFRIAACSVVLQLGLAYAGLQPLNFVVAITTLGVYFGYVVGHRRGLRQGTEIARDAAVASLERLRTPFSPDRQKLARWN